jgi:hypothetical protein
VDKVFKALIPVLQRAVGSPSTPPPSLERASDPALPHGWTEFYAKVAGYEAAVQLRSSWDATVHVLTARRKLIAGIEDAVHELLPELGINPLDRFEAHDFNMVRRPRSETEDQEVAQAVAGELRAIREKLENANLKAGLRGRIDAVLAELGKKEDQKSEATATVEVRYDVLRGAQLPLGAAGAPAQDNTLEEPERAALRKASGTFSSAILTAQKAAEDPQKPEEAGVTLARALHNVSPNERYEFLRLQPEERDFTRVRVLSETLEMGDALREVSAFTFKVMDELLLARARLSDVSEPLLADWLIADAIVRTLPVLAGRMVKRLVEEDEDFEMLQKLVGDANALNSKIQGVRVQKHWFWRDANKLRWACAKVYEDNGSLWEQLLPRSERAAQHRLHNRWLTAADKDELGAVPKRLSESIELLTALRNSIKRLRDADELSRTRLRDFMKQPLGTWPDALRPRLVRMRLMRRQLLLNYALSVLKAGGWITPHGVAGSDGLAPRPLVDANRRLKNAIAELDSRFPELKAHGQAKFEAVSIGRPNNTAFAVEQTESGKEIKNDEYRMLVAALELDHAEPKSEAWLWEPPR